MYPPVVLARGGAGSYRVVVQQSRLPPGLSIVDGLLSGVPTQAGRYDFVLEVQDGSSPPQAVRQGYSLVISRPRAASRKPAPASAPAPLETEVPATLAESTLMRTDQDQIVIYRMLQKDLDSIAPPEGDAPTDDKQAKPPDAAEMAKETVDLLRKLQDKLDQMGLPSSTIDSAAWEAAGQAPPGTARPAQRAAPGTPATPARPLNLAQLREMLQPMVDVEYPSLPLFDAALRGRQCGYMVELLRKGFREREGEAKNLPHIDCPRPPPAKAAPRSRADKRATTSAGAWSLRDFHDSLLPDDIRETVIELARVPIDRNKAADLRWADADCDCAHEIGNHDVVYGIHPFWRSREPRKEPEVDFSRFHRISVLGVQFDHRLELVVPPEWRTTVSRLARDAHRHNTELDMLLQREDWQMLRSLPPEQVTERAVRAARTAFQIYNTNLESWLPNLRHLLLPWWTEPETIFTGITIMFTDSPQPGVRDPADPMLKRFQDFYHAFVLELIEQMKHSRRPATLNLVIPDQQIGRDGPFNWHQLMAYIHRAEKRSNPNIPEGSGLDDYRPDQDPGSDITLRLVVPLAQPTTLSKKELRRQIDDVDIRGHHRVALLDAIVPMLFHPAGAQVVALDHLEDRQLMDDLAYFRHNFGGIAMWPVPVRGIGAGNNVLCQLERSYFEALPHAQDCPESEQAGHQKWTSSAFTNFLRRAEPQVCMWVCPNRSLLRLLEQGLFLAALLGVVTWRSNCAVRKYGPWVLVTLWVLILLAAIVGSGLMICDPELRTVRDGNAILYVLLAAIAVAGLWFSIKPRVLTP